MIQFPEFNQVNVFTGFADLGKVSDLIKKHLGGYNIYTPNVDYEQGTLTIERTCVEGNWSSNLITTCEGFYLPPLFEILFMRRVIEKTVRLGNKLFIFTHSLFTLNTVKAYQDSQEGILNELREDRVSYFLVGQDYKGISFTDVSNELDKMYHDYSTASQLLMLGMLNSVDFKIWEKYSFPKD